jgi:hypothetical protein
VHVDAQLIHHAFPLVPANAAHHDCFERTVRLANS